MNRVDKYLELSKLIDDAFNKGNDKQEKELGKKFIANKEQMSIEELESLECLVSKREFYEGIVPYINNRRGFKKAIPPKKQKASDESVATIDLIRA